MKNVRTLFILLVLVAWWQKDTLDDRAQTNTSAWAYTVQALVNAWGAVTPASPAKDWITHRDEALEQWFAVAPQKSSLQEVQEKTPAAQQPDVVATVKIDEESDAISRKMRHENVSAKQDVSPPPAVYPDIARIVIAGDSMSGDVGLSLRQIAARYKKATGKDVTIVDTHRHSTGLVVPSYYNWPVELKTDIQKHSPQVVVFMVGANDGQAMRLEDKSWVKLGTHEWQEEYTKRTRQIVNISKDTTLVWLDLPPMRSTDLQMRTSQVNDAIEQGLQDCGHCRYVKTRQYFGGDTYKDNLRSKDGVHYSRAGANYVASEIWKTLGIVLPE